MNILNISAKGVFFFLIGINLTLISLHLVFQYFAINSELSSLLNQITARFNMDEEVSVPTWFSQSLLLLTSGLFAYIALATRSAKELFSKTWDFLAILFLFASIDEGSSLHELATEPMQQIFGITEGAFFFAWVIPGIAICLIICLSLLRFFLQLPTSSKIIFGLAALSLFGAIGTEMISGSYWEAQNFQTDFIYRALNALEEGLENTAFILTIYGLLRTIAKYPTKQLPTIHVVK